MNNIKIIMFKPLRRYATKSASAGIRGKIALSKMNKNFETDIENFDQEGMGIYESDFMEVTESYISHKRETQKTKEQLSRRIVKSKVFKEVEPSFLTYVEKEEIKKLHQNNPEEWTPEKLSQSFPALPETIRKVLKSKWVSKTVEKIYKYDNKVIENWKQFKTGKLALNPTLRNHLMKFKDRKIILHDKETLIEKFIPPKIEFPKPQNSFFSDIIKQSINEKVITGDKLLTSSLKDTNRDEKGLDIEKEKGIELINQKTNDSIDRQMNKIEKNNNKEHLVFDEFLKRRINNLHKVSSEEKVTLMDVYKKHIESKDLKNINSNILKNVTKHTVKEKSVSVVNNLSDENALTVKRNEGKCIETANLNTSLDTCVKEWNSYMDTNTDYTKHIKIPKNAYKKGMMYRIKDCYYDDDGEFLYRVPGLKS